MLADELRMDEVQSGSYSGPEGGFSSFTRSVLRTRFAEISFGSIPTMRQARTYLAAHDFGPQSVGWPTKREQIVFAPLAGLRDGRRFAPCSFVFEQSFEHADGGMERRAPTFGCFAVPAAIFELLAQELIGQCVVRFLEIRTKAEDSAVDAGLRFAVKERPVVQPLKHEPLVDAVDHFASFLAGGVETEVHQDNETVEGNKQASVLLRQIVSPPAGAPAPVASKRLAGEKLRSPAVACDARPLGCNRVGWFTGEVPHDLPTDRRVRTEEPFEVRGAGCVIV